MTLDEDNAPFYQAIADNFGYDYHDEHDRQVVIDYHEEHYRGSAITKGDFAYELADEMDGIPDSPWWIRYVDWERAAHELEVSGDMWCECIDGMWHYWWSY